MEHEELYSREEKTTGGLPNKVVDILQQKYLIRQEWRSGSRWYELTHDRLIEPIRESNREWKQKKKFKKIISVVSISIIFISLFFISAQTNIQQQQESINSNRALIDQLTKGINYYGLGQYNQALLQFDKILAIEPNFTEALFYKGLTLQDSGHYEEAVQWYDKILSRDPNNVYALNNKGSALYKLGNFSEAIEYLDKALAIDPNNVHAVTVKGAILNELGKSQESIRYFDKALAIDPNNVEALNSKAFYLAISNKNEEALPHKKSA